MIRSLHILAGSLALVSGAIALFAAKGSWLHRRAGQVFLVAMWTMCGSAAISAGLLRPNRVNLVAALLGFHLVTTAWLTLRWPVERYRPALTALTLLALGVGARALDLGLEALASARGNVDGIPAPPLLLFALVGLSAGALDARLLMAGRIAGAARLVRHLWRMGFALFLTTASFFLGQAAMIPEPLRRLPLMVAPVLLVVITVGYWLARTLWRARRRTKDGAPVRT